VPLLRPYRQPAINDHVRFLDWNKARELRRRMAISSYTHNQKF
jgi:hypothetical protein